MSLVIAFSVIAYVMAAVATMMLLRRAHNWRIRFLGIVLCLMSVFQMFTLHKGAGVLRLLGEGRLIEFLILPVAGLSLTAVLVLYLESRACKRADRQLRLAEFESPYLLRKPAADKPARKLRHNAPAMAGSSPAGPVQ